MESLRSSGSPGNCYIQAGLELRYPPTSASLVLGLKSCTTMPAFLFLIVRS